MGAAAFRMGEEESARSGVVVSATVQMMVTELSQAMWTSVTGRAPADGCPTGPELPAVCLTWCDAVQAANALSRAQGLAMTYEVRAGAGGCDVRWDQAAPGWRLPTEAEWELAARGGAREGWPVATEPARMCRVANVLQGPGGFGCDDGFAELAPVGGRERNPYGLMDLAGNAAEWVWDVHAPLPAELGRDPSGPSEGPRRAVRGGSWRTPAAELVPGRREAAAPGTAREDLGVRFVRSDPGGPVFEGP